MGKVLEKKNKNKMNGMVRRDNRPYVERYLPYVRTAVRAARQIQRGYQYGQRVSSALNKAARYFKYNSSPPNSPRSAPKKARTNNNSRYTAKYSHNRSGGRGRTSRPSVRRSANRYGKRKMSKRTSRKSRKNVKPHEGVVMRNETIQKVTDLNCHYIGHANFAPNQALELIGRAIAKTFWAKEGLIVENDATQGPAFANVWRFTYYATPTSTTVTQVDSATNAANDTFAVCFARLIILMRSLMAASDNKIKWQSLSWLSIPSASDYRFKHTCNMVTSFISGNILSTIAIQNSTANALGGTTTDVNNANPLHVHKYHGKGNGTELIIRTNSFVGPPVYTSFIADPDRGNIAVTADQVDGNHLKEPPKPHVFAHTKGGKYNDNLNQ